MNARKMTTPDLMHARRDLTATIEVQEDLRLAGHRCPKLGRYHDDLHAVAQELRRREKGEAAHRYPITRADGRTVVVMVPVD